MLLCKLLIEILEPSGRRGVSHLDIWSTPGLQVSGDQHRVFQQLIWKLQGNNAAVSGLDEAQRPLHVPLALPIVVKLLTRHGMPSTRLLHFRF